MERRYAAHMPSIQPPAEAELIAGFVNTAEIEKGTDDLATTAGLGAWLRSHGFAGDDPTEEERRRAVELREALREILAGHNGHDVDPEAVDDFNRLAGEARLGVTLDGDGRPRLRAAGGGTAAAIAAITAAVAEAAERGTWERLKICREDSCQWAFYDRSKNRSGTWCDMQVCGSRAKMRSYRLRKAAATR